MNARLFLIPAILTTTAAFGDSADVVSAPRDAHAQAAGLLSGVQVGHGTQTAVHVSRSAVVLDAHAQAAALLSGVHAGDSAETAVHASRSAVVLDAHAQAAALLSGSRIVTKDSRIGETAETLGQHPAVLVAQKWSTRGIDPNTFIVAHPARLHLLTAADEISGRVAAAR